MLPLFFAKKTNQYFSRGDAETQRNAGNIQVVKRLCYLLSFGQAFMKSGITQIVNNLT
jgi:hypothetical protein